MTRFLMSLEEALELVLFAFENVNAGDLFVNKTPVGAIGISPSFERICNADIEIKVFGTRHGKKLDET